MKKTSVLLLALIVSMSLLVACGTSTNANTGNNSNDNSGGEEKTFNLKLGSIRTDEDPATSALKEFVKLVDEKSNGTIKVTLYNNSVLGGLTDMLPGMTTGVVDMMHDRISCYGMLDGAAKFNIAAAPFLWESYEQLEGFMNSDDAKVWFDEAAKSTGVRAFAVKGETEARELSSSKPVVTADDFKGLKVRTAEIAVVQQTMKALGAEPVVIPFNDLYMSLRQGTADAQENGFLTIKNSSLYEVQKYLMQTDYIRDISAYYISENIWNQMSENQKNAMIEAANEAGEIESQITREQINETLELLKEKMDFVEIDLDSVRAKLGDSIYEQFDAEGRAWATGAYEVIKNYKGKN
jgi:tripartite ATP-independent transporter DctP family solute receptor